MAQSIRNSIARIALVNVNTNALVLRLHARGRGHDADYMQTVAGVSELLQVSAEDAHEAIRLVIDECTFNGLVDQQNLQPLADLSQQMVDAAIEAEVLEVMRCVAAIRSQLSMLL